MICELQSPYLYFMNEEGSPVREGKAAIPYVVYQTPKSYTTTFNSQSVTVSNRAGSIIVPTADTIQRNFKATFTVQPNSDVSTTVERSTNAINIPAYHRIYDFAVKEGKDAQGSYTGAKTLSWTIRNPQAEDLMSTDYFEIQRAQKEDYSDAQTIQLLPMTPDSSTYTYVDETTVPAGTAVTEDSLQRYYNIDYKNYVLKSEEFTTAYVVLPPRHGTGIILSPSRRHCSSTAILRRWHSRSRTTRLTLILRTTVRYISISKLTMRR